MRASDSLPVLCYHSVAATSTSPFAPFTIDPDLFEAHLAALLDDGFEFVCVRDVPAALAQGRRAVAISLDDGLADAATNAAPVLSKLGVRATLFVPTGYVGDTARWFREGDEGRALLGWSQLEELSDAGFEVASHGQMHLAADVSPVELVRRDAEASKIELEDRLGQAVESFAYPYGHHNAAARKAIRAAGFTQAFTVGDFPARAGDDLWALPRLDIRAGTTADALLARIHDRPSAASRGFSQARGWTTRLRRRWQARRISAAGTEGAAAALRRLGATVSEGRVPR
jgi:peptidoglycan/xylan/chitin deacetylase (PgdA/CDA1 family)